MDVVVELHLVARSDHSGHESGFLDLFQGVEGSGEGGYHAGEFDETLFPALREQLFVGVSVDGGHLTAWKTE